MHITRMIKMIQDGYPHITKQTKEFYSTLYIKSDAFGLCPRWRSVEACDEDEDEDEGGMDNLCDEGGMVEDVCDVAEVLMTAWTPPADFSLLSRACSSSRLGAEEWCDESSLSESLELDGRDDSFRVDGRERD